jgi:hypothetical protein
MTEKRAYAFKPRVSFPIDAQTAGEALEKIKGHNSGDLTPEAVVEAAKDAKSPLHPVFEWDDAKAGYQFRVQQAGVLIRAVIVTVSGGEQTSQKVDAKVTDSSRAAGTAQAHIVTPEELHRQRVEKGWTALIDWHKQYGDVSEFAGVAAALSGFLAMRVAEKKKAAA